MTRIDPSLSFHDGRRWFSLGLALVSFVVAATTAKVSASTSDVPLKLLLFFSASGALGMAIGGYAAYTLTRQSETPAGKGGVPRPVALTLLVPLFAFPIAAMILGSSTGSVVAIPLAVFGGLMVFGLPCVATTFLWSVLFLYVIRPWRLRRIAGGVGSY